MRIAFVVRRFPAISETFILNQITGLIDRGHVVDIYAKVAGGASEMHFDPVAYPLMHRLRLSPRTPVSRMLQVAKGIGVASLSGWRDPRRLRLLSPTARRRHRGYIEGLLSAGLFLGADRYDVVHCHFAQNALPLIWLREAGALDSPLVVTFHGRDANVLPGRWGRDCYRDLFAVAAMCTAGSHFMCDRVRSLGAAPEKVMCLPMGISMRNYSFRARSLNAGDEIRLLTVGRLVEVKGVELSIRAISAIAPRFPKLRYQVVGDGPLRPHLRQLANDLGIGDKVSFLGFLTQDRLREVYAAAHIFLLTGIVGSDGAEEGQGLVYAEAQACGLPVVASRVGGASESVDDGRSGFTVPPGNVGAIAERLSELLSRPDSWPTMGAAGRSFVEQRFDSDVLNDRLVELYDDVATGDVGALPARKCTDDRRSLNR